MTLTVRDVVATLRSAEIEDDQGSDRLIAGSLDAAVGAIAVSFMPSHRVVEEAVRAGADLLVVHEGAYYSHHDLPDRFHDDPVVQAKRALIDGSGLAIYRCHDYWHRIRPDGLMIGFLSAIDWERFVHRHDPTSSVVLLPRPHTVGEVALTLKRRLGLSAVRVVGDLSMPCERIGVTVGCRGGGDHAIPLFRRNRIDLLVVGEGAEWETPEYVKDAFAQGRNAALVVVGHAESEVPGMRLLAERLRGAFAGVPVAYIEEPPPFQVL
ncbi:Nif3-like dinuclear metal center hexameric protein [Cohnella sp. GCM10027633]|uniref:Nif3-like dinuclear metal center hexameric protein n=1 Tax=unclassified Cohnella TaxID=2636738 RepID=UPI00363DF97F